MILTLAAGGFPALLWLLNLFWQEQHHSPAADIMGNLDFPQYCTEYDIYGVGFETTAL